MYEFHPYFTNDGSTGLYNSACNDIYHSATGALTEAYEKFIYPIDSNNLLAKEKINVLDICYGIGYNTKSFLKFLYENIALPNNYATVHTDNAKNKTDYYGKIYTDNIFSKISITAVDSDEILLFLSPFIKTGVRHYKNEKLNFNYPNIKKYLYAAKPKHPPKIYDLINFLLFEKIAQNEPEFLGNDELASILNEETYKPYLNSQIKGLHQFYLNSCDTFNTEPHKRLNLHNIYYKYLSKHYKNTLKSTKLEDINFIPKIGDAREIIKVDKNTYDLIFLDAFTPSKCPCLWSLEFFQELYNHLDEDGMLLTYSMSAPVRNAMLQSGFTIGNNIHEGKCIGTISVKNPTLIKHPLSEFEFGLLKTKSGIVYRDKNLTDQNESIIERRNAEVKNSNLISSSKYKKKFKIL